ncbi:hypothetical protein QMT40_001053 [Parvibaculaceae bacterium PLY_AMNH_Bact1]|nr:hypothetical protein QMT40_001053 [Parvibaculaceae bacterium PLY_AMNH_Bact1]
MTDKIIDWDYPAVRRGISGFFDKGAGPGATAAEVLLQLLLPGAATLAAYLYAQTVFPDWPWWKLLLFCFLAFDMVGGIVTNATSSAKRWFHRATQTRRNHLGFIVLHLFHIALVAIVFRDFDWVYGLALSAFLLSAAALVLAFPLYLQRPIALFLFALGLLLEIYGWGTSSELPWFTSFLLLKLLVAHLLLEEPYRP